MRHFSTTWLFTAVLIFFCSKCEARYEKCDSYEWYKYEDNCYSFESGNQKLSFYDAEDYCRSKGSHLVSIHSEEELKFLNELHGKHGGRRWIGLNILEGDYLWTDGSSIDYLKFYNKTQYKIEKCFMLYGSYRPEHCELRYIPICKKPATAVTPTPIPPITPVVREGNCPKDWLQVGQKCFKFYGQEEADRKLYKQAKVSCQTLGKDHDLVSIHSMEEQAFLTAKLGLFGSSAWIGMSHVESDEIGQILVFGWTDNSRVNFTYWAPGHPERGTWKYCARLGYDGVGNGEWIADYCELNKYGYICERFPDSSLPPREPEQSSCEDPDYEGYRGSCYKFFSEEKSWAEAEKTCQNLGSHLVSIEDSFENAFLYNYLSVKADYIWNGLKTVDGSRILRWSDKTPFYYAKWVSSPKMPTKESSCTYMISSDELKWNVTQCAKKLPFVCESKKGTPQPQPKDFIGKCPSDDSSWIDIGDGFCYHVADTQNDRLLWGTLSRYCLSKGMKMLTLNSDHQTKQLMAYLWEIPYNFWLGLIRTFDRKSFMWVDQSPFNYTNWEQREPSSWSSDKDCVTFSPTTSKWKIEACNEWRGSICRAKKA